MRKRTHWTENLRVRMLLLIAVLVALCSAPAAALGPTDVTETKTLEWLLKQTAYGTPPAAGYMSLHSGDPGDTCANELAATGNYARAQLNPDANNSTNTNFNAVTQPATAKTITNKLSVAFATANANWNSSNPIQYWCWWDASTSGNCYWCGNVTGGGVVVLSGNTLSFSGGSPGSLAWSLD